MINFVIYFVLSFKCNFECKRGYVISLKMIFGK